MNILKKIYNLLSSAKLAMALLVIILACCVSGVTIWRGIEAGRVIFATLWFNGLLVLLVVNVACCFFGRMWGRRVTLISFGMILFHLSFVVIMGAIIYNSFFYFKGVIRLTEGETLSSGDPMSYDTVDQGRFFSFSHLKGETTLIRMHAGYKFNGKNKRAAYEISVGEAGLKKEGIIYPTKHLSYKGFRYYKEMEGYSILTVMFDKEGREIYGAFIPLQSYLQEDGNYYYITGTKDAPGSSPFPKGDVNPLLHLQAAYGPDPIEERAGEAHYQVWPLTVEPAEDVEPAAEGIVALGEKFDTGEHYLLFQEVRYWVAMTVRYDPGLPVVLTFLWVSLGGMVITFIGRLRRRRK